MLHFFNVFQATVDEKLAGCESATCHANDTCDDDQSVNGQSTSGSVHSFCGSVGSAGGSSSGGTRRRGGNPRRRGRRHRRGGGGRRAAGDDDESDDDELDDAASAGGAAKPPWWWYHMARPAGVSVCEERGFPIYLPSGQAVYILHDATNGEFSQTYLPHDATPAAPLIRGPIDCDDAADADGAAAQPAVEREDAVSMLTATSSTTSIASSASCGDLRSLMAFDALLAAEDDDACSAVSSADDDDDTFFVGGDDDDASAASSCGDCWDADDDDLPCDRGEGKGDYHDHDDADAETCSLASRHSAASSYYGELSSASTVAAKPTITAAASPWSGKLFLHGDASECDGCGAAADKLSFATLAAAISAPLKAPGAGRGRAAAALAAFLSPRDGYALF